MEVNKHRRLGEQHCERGVPPACCGSSSFIFPLPQDISRIKSSSLKQIIEEISNRKGSRTKRGRVLLATLSVRKEKGDGGLPFGLVTAPIIFTRL